MEPFLLCAKGGVDQDKMINFFSVYDFRVRKTTKQIYQDKEMKNLDVSRVMKCMKIVNALVLIFVLAFGCSSVYATCVVFNGAAAWSITPDGVMGTMYYNKQRPTAGPTISLEYGSTTPFLLRGAWSVDTPYQKYWINLSNISQDELHVGAAIWKGTTLHNNLDVDVITPVLSGTPDVIYWPNGRHGYDVYPDECTYFITNSGWLEDGDYPLAPWHTSNCGFYICPQPGQSYTNSFYVGMVVGTCSSPSGGMGAEAAWKVTYNFIVEPPTIEATVDIDPDTLNLQSKGQWIACYIKLPEDYDVDDIDVGSILLEYLLEVQHSDVQDDMLMVKFDSQDVMAYVELVLEIELPADVTLMVTGELTDRTPFEGSDTIRVIDEGVEE